MFPCSFFFPYGGRRRFVASAGKYLCVRRHTSTDIIHHSEWQESHKYQSCCDSPNLIIRILLSNFYFFLITFLFATIRNFTVSL